MDSDSHYSINTEIIYGPLEIIDVPGLIAASNKEWQNFSLCEVNNCVVRLGVIHGEFHWHKHDDEDEVFYVISGMLLIDVDEQTFEINPGQGLMVPKGVTHRTRAPVRTSILMVEGKTVKPTGNQQQVD